MKKTVLFLLVSLALVTTLAVNGTFANEGNPIFKTLENILESFGITPSTSPEKLEVEVVSEVYDRARNNNAVLAPAHYDSDINWNSTPGVVSYETYVQNVKKEAAYVRICIYVKKHDCLMYTKPEFEGNGSFSAQLGQEVFITHVDTTNPNYTLYIFDYNGRLADSSLTTPTIKMKVALSKDTTNAEMKELSEHGDFIQVYAFAIQAKAFANLDANGNKLTAENTKAATPTQALALAMGAIGNFNPYSNLFQ